MATRCTPAAATGRAASAAADFGADFKNEITRPGQWNVFIEGYGETLPYHDNRIWLSHDKPDPWGIPTINISMSYRDNERAMAQQMMEDAVEMLKAAKLENVAGLQSTRYARQRDPRDGHGAHGSGSEDFGAELTQPVACRAECVRDRRQLHGVVADAESVAHLYGANCALRLREARAAARPWA